MRMYALLGRPALVTRSECDATSVHATATTPFRCGNHWMALTTCECKQVLDAATADQQAKKHFQRASKINSRKPAAACRALKKSLLPAMQNIPSNSTYCSLLHFTKNAIQIETC
eukprot:1145378-Pelagomonas_calceolata.AAC.10